MGLRHVLRRWHSKVREAIKRSTRSPKWRTVEHKHLLAQPLCAGCGSSKHLQVHHRQPFKEHPELELEPTNLVTACMDVAECHLRICHGDNFKAYNPKVTEHLAQSIGRPALRENVYVLAKAARLFA